MSFPGTSRTGCSRRTASRASSRTPPTSSGRAHAGRLRRVAPYDLVRDLPLEIESYEFRGTLARRLERLHAPDDDVRLRGGATGIGEDVTTTATTSSRSSRLRATAARARTRSTRSRARRPPEPFPSGPDREDYRNYRAGGSSAALDLASARPARRSTRRSDGSRARVLRRLHAARRRPRLSPCSAGSSSTRRSSSSSTRRAAGRRVVEEPATRRRRVGRPQGRLQGHGRRPAAIPRSTRGSRTASRTRGSRIRR